MLVSKEEETILLWYYSASALKHKAAAALELPPTAGKETHLHLKIQCTENGMTTSPLISMPNDMHSNRQLCCFYNISLFSIISAFLPPSFLKPFFELYFFLCLIWNLCSAVTKSFSLCLSSEPSLLYIRWEELIQLSPKLHFKSLKPDFTDKLESTPTAINTGHSLFCSVQQ